MGLKTLMHRVLTRRKRVGKRYLRLGGTLVEWRWKPMGYAFLFHAKAHGLVTSDQAASHLTRSHKVTKRSQLFNVSVVVIGHALQAAFEG